VNVYEKHPGRRVATPGLSKLREMQHAATVRQVARQNGDLLA
jgi:hypothetical protein